MKKAFYIISTAIAALLAAACSVEEVEKETVRETEEQPVPLKLDGGCIAGRATIVFDDEMVALIESDLAAGQLETKSPALNSVLKDLGIVSLERVFPDAGEFEARSRREGLHRFYTVVFDDEVPMTKATVALESIPGIQQVTPERPIFKRAVFDDPLLSKQWHYINSKYPVTGDINVQEVWEKYTTGSDKVVVCVVDEPVDATHPDLKANLWQDASGHTGYNYARSSYDLSIRPAGGEGDVGHGTHVAGTVSAVNNNGIGVCGVAGGNSKKGIGGVRLMSHAIFSGTDYASDSKSARAIKEAADKGALISQNSWGLSADLNGDGKITSSEISTFKSWSMDDDPTMKKAVDYFIQYAGCDADGNQLPDSPMKGGLVFFAAGNEGDYNVDWDPYASYDPIVAVGSFRETGASASYSNYGKWVDVAAPGGAGSSASNSVWSTLPEKVADMDGSSVTSTNYYGGTYWAGTSMACPHASGVAALIVSYFGKEGFTADDARKILEGGLGNTIGGSKPIGKKLDALGAFEWALAHGYTGNGGPTEEPAPPVIAFNVNSATIHAHETGTVIVTITDPNFDAFTVDFDGGSPAATMAGNAGDWTMTIIGRNAPAGSYVARITATDETGLATVAEYPYTILANHAPKLIKNMSGFLFESVAAPARSFTVTDVFADEDDEVPVLTIDNTNSGVATAKVVDDQLVVTPKKPGFATITVTGTDALGLSASASFAVAVQQPGAITVQTYPTTVTDTLNIHTDGYQTYTQIRIYTTTGALVYEETVKTSFDAAYPLNLSSLAPGRYLLEVTYDGQTVTRYFIKM